MMQGLNCLFLVSSTCVRACACVRMHSYVCPCVCVYVKALRRLRCYDCLMAAVGALKYGSSITRLTQTMALIPQQDMKVRYLHHCHHHMSHH